MLYKSIVFLLVSLTIFFTSCVSNVPLAQHTLDEVDRQMTNYLINDQLNYQTISLPPKYPDIPKIHAKVAVIVESSSALKKFPNAENLFFYSIISMLSNYFIEVKPGGIIDSKQSADTLISTLHKSREVDLVLLITDIVPAFYGDNYNMYRKISFNYTYRDFNDETSFSQVLTAYMGIITNLDILAQKQLLTSVILNSTHEIEYSLFEERAEGLQRKALLAEERRRKAELLEKLKAKREMFLPYGFDVLDFVTYAKGNLKIRGDIDFGGGVPEIDFRTFKDKNYVEVKINYLVTYNTLRVSMYEAASMTFDEIVKKLAKKISTDFKKQNEIAGFIFNITYTNKDFSEKYDVPRYVTNEFILPKEACRQYATLDITNQDLINQSIVLVDGERISLNLQISK